jgi:hypothetical protein
MVAESKTAAKSLFGRALRVLLAEWISSRGSEPFYLHEAQKALEDQGEAGSAVRKELDNFIDYQMLTRIQPEQRVYYQVLESPFWAAFSSISDALASYRLQSAPLNADAGSEGAEAGGYRET